MSLEKLNVNAKGDRVSGGNPLYQWMQGPLYSKPLPSTFPGYRSEPSK